MDSFNSSQNLQPCDKKPGYHFPVVRREKEGIKAKTYEGQTRQ